MTPQAVKPKSTSVDWSGLERGFSPGEPGDALYLLRGFAGTGKTSFACGFPKSLLIDCDPMNGGKYVVGGSAERERVNSWDKLDDITKRLEADTRINGANRRFNMVIIDPTSIFQTFIAAAVMKKFGLESIEGFDHGKVGKAVRDFLFRLTDAGYYWTVVDQLTRRFALSKNGETPVTEALLNTSTTKYLENDCHHILTMTLVPESKTVTEGGKTKVVTTTKRVLETKPSFNKTTIANAKSRVWLPEKIELPTGTAADMYREFKRVYDEAASVMVTADQNSRKEA